MSTYATPKQVSGTNNPSEKVVNIGKGFLNYLKIFFQETTLHGLKHIVTVKRHWAEMLLWIIVVCGATGGAIWIILTSYERYRANPTVVTLDKDYRNWNVTLPAHTFCFVDKFDEEKAAKTIGEKWNVTEGGKEFDYFKNFLQVLAQSSYNNLKDLEIFSDDKRLLNADLTQLMDSVQFELSSVSPTLFNDETVFYKKTMLEAGICYTISSPLTKMFVPNARGQEVGDKKKERDDIQYCSFFNTMCYGVLEHLPRDTVHYVHAPNEVPDVYSKAFKVTVSSFTELLYEYFEITASDKLRDLRPNQRRCVFYNEKVLKNSHYYSYNLCQMQCRRDRAMKLCGCVPHFYMRQAGQEVCNIKQLKCISEKSQEITQIGLSRTEITENCECYSPCDYTHYNLEEERTKSDGYRKGMPTVIVTTFTWRISSFGKSRYRRDILFGFEDLLVSFGGTAAFFLGCSLMSGVELIYYFTLRLLRYVVSNSRNKDTERKNDTGASANKRLQRRTRLQLNVVSSVNRF